MRVARATLLLAMLVAGCGGGRKPASPAALPAPTSRPPAAVAEPTSTPSSTSTTAGAPRRTTASAGATVRLADFATALTTRKQTLMASGRRVSRDEVGYYMDVQEARLRQLGGTDLKVTRRELSLVLEISGPVAFEVGSARLSARAMSVLTNVAKVLGDYRFSIVSIHGHTDDSGDAAQNQALSEQRALAVSRQLIADGVTADRILVVGHGAASPLVPNTTPEGRLLNRRIELQVDPLVP